MGYAGRGGSQVCLADIPAPRAAILVVHRVDVEERVLEAAAARARYRVRQGGERDVRVDRAVVYLPVVVLDLLHEHDVWQVQEVRDVVRDRREIRRRGCHILYLEDDTTFVLPHGL